MVRLIASLLLLHPAVRATESQRPLCIDRLLQQFKMEVDVSPVPAMTTRNRTAYNTWAATYDVEIPPHSELEKNHLVELVSPNRKDKILDVACGTGRMTEIWRQNGADVVGVDVSEEMLRLAQQKLPDVAFHHADLNAQLPFLDDQFDKISGSLFLRHIGNIQGMFSELWRITKPGGLLVVSTIHPEMDWSHYERLVASSIDLNAEGDNFKYSIEEMKQYAVKAGWQLSSTREIFSDDSIRPFLTPSSFEYQRRGIPYVWILSATKPRRHR